MGRWDTFFLDWDRFLFIETGFGTVGTYSFVLGHILVFWDTLLCVGTHSCVLGHILVFWDTFMFFGTHSCFLGHIYDFWDTFSTDFGTRFGQFLGATMKLSRGLA